MQINVSVSFIREGGFWNAEVTDKHGTLLGSSETQSPGYSEICGEIRTILEAEISRKLENEAEEHRAASARVEDN